jgi:hypothetical protein
LWLFKAYVNISTDPRKRANQKGAQFWEHAARQFAAIREADLLEMEKDEKMMMIQWFGWKGMVILS